MRDISPNPNSTDVTLYMTTLRYLTTSGTHAFSMAQLRVLIRGVHQVVLRVSGRSSLENDLLGSSLPWWLAGVGSNWQSLTCGPLQRRTLHLVLGVLQSGLPKTEGTSKSPHFAIFCLIQASF